MGKTTIQMKIVDQNPPNYFEITQHFPDLEIHKPIFCFGDTIYNPFHIEITKDLEIHEEVHYKQQGGLPEAWWIRYIYDLAFRLSQEIEAYGTQWLFINSLNMSSKIKRWKLEQMALALSGPLYSHLLSYGEAESKIRNYKAL